MKPLGATGLRDWQSSYVEFDSDSTWIHLAEFGLQCVASFSVMTTDQMSFSILWNAHSRPRSCAKTPLTAVEERRKKKKEELTLPFWSTAAGTESRASPGMMSPSFGPDWAKHLHFFEFIQDRKVSCINLRHNLGFVLRGHGFKDRIHFLTHGPANLYYTPQNDVSALK